MPPKMFQNDLIVCNQNWQSQRRHSDTVNFLFCNVPGNQHIKFNLFVAAELKFYMKNISKMFGKTTFNYPMSTYKTLNNRISGNRVLILQFIFNLIF